MAIYEYVCPVCGTFEVFQRMSDPPLQVCPECEKKGTTSQVTKILSAPAFHLKGKGWYKTDYASSSNGSGGGSAHHHHHSSCGHDHSHQSSDANHSSNGTGEASKDSTKEPAKTESPAKSDAAKAGD